MENRYPTIKYIGNKKVTAQQLQHYDFVIVRVDYTSHTTYRGARKVIDNSGLPACYLKKGENRVETVAKKVLQTLGEI